MIWLLTLHGGHYDRFEGYTDSEPAAVIVAWQDAAESRVTSDPENPRIVLESAQSYRRAAVDLDRRRVSYEFGPEAPPLGVADRIRQWTGPRR